MQSTGYAGWQQGGHERGMSSHFNGQLVRRRHHPGFAMTTIFPAQHGRAWQGMAWHGDGMHGPCGAQIWATGGDTATYRYEAAGRQRASLVGICRYRRETAVVIMIQEGMSRDSGLAIDGGERQRQKRRGCGCINTSNQLRSGGFELFGLLDTIRSPPTPLWHLLRFKVHYSLQRCSYYLRLSQSLRWKRERKNCTCSHLHKVTR
ncbi:hypothetical protein J3F83DRAFT_321300 [Trichoderma novae-zelandiae]